MKHLACALLLCLATLPALALAGPGCTTGYCAPARYSYRPVRSYTPPVVTHHVHHAHEIVFADAFFGVFDVVNTRDVFVFTGPPPAVPSGLVIGVRPTNTEVRVSPTPAVPTSPAPPKLPRVDPGDGPLLGYEGDSTTPAPSAPAPDLAFLHAACSRCHSAPKGKGGVTLFDGSGKPASAVDWKAVLDAVSPRGTARPAMPPSGDPLTAAQLATLRSLIR